MAAASSCGQSAAAAAQDAATCNLTMFSHRFSLLQNTTHNLSGCSQIPSPFLHLHLFTPRPSPRVILVPPSFCCISNAPCVRPQQLSAWRSPNEPLVDTSLSSKWQKQEHALVASRSDQPMNVTLNLFCFFEPLLLLQTPFVSSSTSLVRRA